MGSLLHLNLSMKLRRVHKTSSSVVSAPITKNRIAEQAIQMVLSMAHMILIHAATHWPKVADTSLWPMAVDYVIHHHNHMPCTSADNMSPFGSHHEDKVSCNHFQGMHVWGCPCYVLKPTLLTEFQQKELFLFLTLMDEG